jgi:hypothetical protein
MNRFLLVMLLFLVIYSISWTGITISFYFSSRHDVVSLWYLYSPILHFQRDRGRDRVRIHQCSAYSRSVNLKTDLPRFHWPLNENSSNWNWEVLDVSFIRPHRQNVHSEMSFCTEFVVLIVRFLCTYYRRTSSYKSSSHLWFCVRASYLYPCTSA